MRPGHTALSLVVSQHICGQLGCKPLTCLLHACLGIQRQQQDWSILQHRLYFTLQQRGQIISLMRSCWMAGGFCTSPSALRLYPSSTTLKVRLPKHGRPADTPSVPGILTA